MFSNFFCFFLCFFQVNKSEVFTRCLSDKDVKRRFSVPCGHFKSAIEIQPALAELFFGSRRWKQRRNRDKKTRIFDGRTPREKLTDLATDLLLQILEDVEPQEAEDPDEGGVQMSQMSQVQPTQESDAEMSQLSEM